MLLFTLPLVGCIPLPKTYTITYVQSVVPLADGRLKVRTCKQRVIAGSADDKRCKTRTLKPREEK